MMKKTVRESKAVKRILSIFLLLSAAEHADAATITNNGTSIIIQDDNYQMNIELNQFKYSFSHLDNSTIAPNHNVSGLTLNGSHAVSSIYDTSASSTTALHFSVVFADQSMARVTVFPLGKSVRLSVEPDTTNSPNNIFARLGHISGPFYGLGDDGIAGNLTNLTNKAISNDGGHDRFISTFAIAPNSFFAQVAISQVSERHLSARNLATAHKVSIDQNSTEMGTSNVISNKHFYYFFGAPKGLYKEFSRAKKAAGYADVKPVYGMFGLGWEAWPFQKYATDASTVEESITHFVDHHDYPLSWAVIGSGFWEDGGTTTSFGRFNLAKFPDKNNDGAPDIIQAIRDKGVNVMFGLRTNFPECKGSNDFSGGSTDGKKGACYFPLLEPPEHAEANTNHWFAKKIDGSNVESASAIFPQWDAGFELLDANNPDALTWYRNKTSLWGVDGWKEDSMITSGIYHPGAWNAPMKSLHERGDYVMARNAYVSSPGSIQRLNDTRGQQTRIPQLVLSYAASGAPNVYTDIIGNHSGENSIYMERHAKLAALTASMSFGANPWQLASSKNIKAAADWHEKYRPYIYSAALKTYATGYPYTVTPMPIAFPSDYETYELDNNSMWQWLIGESILAAPVFNSSNTTGLRDVYIPSGYWIDTTTNKAYQGPGILENYEQSGTKIPVFVGGKGIVVNKNGNRIEAEVWPVKPNNVTTLTYEYRHFDTNIDGSEKVSLITLENTGWDTALLIVTNTTRNTPLNDVKISSSRGVIHFNIIPGNNYKVSGGGTVIEAGGPAVDTLTAKRQKGD